MDTLRCAIRTVLRMRGLAIVAILTLGLGIGATTMMFSVVHAMLLKPPPFVDPDRLVTLFNTSFNPRDGLIRRRWSLTNAMALRASAASFETVASYTGALLSTSGDGDPEYIDGEVVSSDYFRTLRVTPVAGRAFRAEEDTAAHAQTVTMLSWRLWQRKFAGNPASLGATIVVNDVPLTVVGILPEGFAGLTGQAQLWIPPPMAARLFYSEYLTTPQSFINVVARLKAGATLASANAELAVIGQRFLGNDSGPYTAWGATGVRLQEARVDPTVRRSALLLLAAAACVLIIGCVNVASLLLARARVRQREIAVRLALGSGRGRLVRLLLTEGLVIAAAAGACGTALARWGVDLLTRTAPAVIPSGGNNYAAIGSLGASAIDPAVLLFTFSIATATTLLFALAPALAASRPDLTTALKEDHRGGRRGHFLSLLVVIEVAIASLLLVASGLLIEAFARMQSQRSGFVADSVLTFWVRPPGSRYPVASGPATLERLLTRIQAVPGVASAAVNRCTPFTGCSRTTLFLPGRPAGPEGGPAVGRHYISADYFDTLGIPIVAGRRLTADDRAGTTPVAVVNQSGARRFWPNESAIGQHVWFGPTTGPFSDPSRPVEIVGVVGDVKYESLDQSDRPDRADFYTSYLQFSYPDTMVIVKAAGPRPATALLPALRAAVASLDPSLPIYDAMTLDQRISLAVSRPRFNATLLGAFAGAALLLAALGVYSMLSYTVSSRLRDLGIRIALGAGRGRVMSLVLGEGLRLAALGAGLGLAASLAMATLARGLVPDAPEWDARLLAIAGIVMLAVSAAAAFLPARRAGAVDPMVMLRHE